MRQSIYDIYVGELLDLAAEFERESYRGATLDLASSWNVTRPKKEAVTFTIKASITNNSQAAINRITGRSPGKMPPVSALIPWVIAKGIEVEPKRVRSAAFAIAMAIKKRGTKRHQTQENFAGLNRDGSAQPGGRLDKARLSIQEKLEAIKVQSKPISKS